MLNYIDNQRPPMSKRDKQVEKRNEVLGLLDRGCTELMSGDRGFLAHILKTIHNDTRGQFAEYTVDTKPEGKYEFFNVDYTSADGIILIKEGNDELIMVIKLKEGKCKGEWRAYELSPYYFETDAQQEAEARWEREAESAYERHLDAKCMYDDPRGY